jgi:hypothetical protein
MKIHFSKVHHTLVCGSCMKNGPSWIATSSHRSIRMTEKQIKYMTEQFLGWKLPENFNPDGGISFEPVGNKGTPHEFKREPTGTNLLDYNQAEAMVMYMIRGLPHD